MKLNHLEYAQRAYAEAVSAGNDFYEQVEGYEELLLGQNIPPERLKVVAKSAWDRGVHIVDRMLAAPTDNEVFHTRKRSKDVTNTVTARCMEPGATEQRVVRENHRDIAVAGLGLITVSRTLEDTYWLTGEGAVEERRQLSRREVAHRLLPATGPVQGLMAVEENGPSWMSLATIALFDEHHESPRPSIVNEWDIARRIDAVDSLGHIAEVLGIELEAWSPELALD